MIRLVCQLFQLVQLAVIAKVRASTRARGGDRMAGAEDVIQFPHGRRAAAIEAHRQWEFDAAVHEARSAEAVWLAGELATVLRDLLAWAREDRELGAESVDDSQGRAA